MLSNQKHATKTFLICSQLFFRFAINTVKMVDFILELIIRQYSIYEKSNNGFFTKFVSDTAASSCNEAERL